MAFAKRNYGVVDSVLQCNCIAFGLIWGSNKSLQGDLSEVTSSFLCLFSAAVQ